MILSGGEPQWMESIAKFGWTGVDLFFVLSGFLISSSLFEQIKYRKQVDLKVFFIKRFFRIMPAYWCVVVIYFLLPLFREKEALPPLWRFLTFTQNFGLDIKHTGTFSHAWSLCVEEHFYFLLPLALIALHSRGLIRLSYLVLISSFLVGLAARLYSFQNLFLPISEEDSSLFSWYKYVYYPTYNRLDGLLAGVSIAAIYHFHPEFWKTISKHGNILLLIGIGILAAAYQLCDDNTSYFASIWGFPLIALGYGALVASSISHASILYSWQSNITSFIATLSYAIYLTHKGLIHLTQQSLASFKINSTLMLICCMITSTLTALILNFIVERPFMKLRSRLLDKI
jgi:peptidoglycan/LPS O-acetylase OafA/YrhL